MHPVRPAFPALAALVVALGGPALAAPIAVTIDDLPLQAIRDRGTADIAAINAGLLAALAIGIGLWGWRRLSRKASVETAPRAAAA